MLNFNKLTIGDHFQYENMILEFEGVPKEGGVQCRVIDTVDAYRADNTATLPKTIQPND